EALSELIGRCLPHGSLASARLEGHNTAIVWIKGVKSTIPEDGRRVWFPRELPLVMAFHLYGGHPHINSVVSARDRESGQRDLNYVYSFAGKVEGEREPRITLERIHADAQPGERVELPD